jgi:hypothetical protein
LRKNKKKKEEVRFVYFVSGNKMKKIQNIQRYGLFVVRIKMKKMKKIQNIQSYGLFVVRIKMKKM